MFTHLPILSLLIWLPIVGASIVLMTGTDDNKAIWPRSVALVTSLILMALCVILYINFDVNTPEMQFQENLPWITSLGINYHLGVDGISLPLIILTTFTTLVVVLAGWNTIHYKVSQYMAAFLIMQSMMIGVFAAMDSLLFFVFWEAMLVPIYLSIGMWGGPNRSYASIKFFLYTFAGSALMLIAILYLRLQADSFAITDFYKLRMPETVQTLIFLAFLLAFSVKVPMWPVHTWLPDAHTEAPAGGSVVLAALMLKMGVYGFLRFSLPIAPDACRHLDWLMIGLSLVAVVYIGLVAIAQSDMKKLVAYSSVAHMGFATLGCFMIYDIIGNTGNVQDAYIALEGAMVQMISHAFSSGAMFVAVGVVYHQTHTRLIKDYGGIVNTMPVFATFFMIYALANVGLPGSSGFVGEFLVILGSFKANFWVTFLAATTLILSACYTLWMYKRVFFGAVANDGVAALKDVKNFDYLALLLLALMVVIIGVYPEGLLRLLHASVGNLLNEALQSKLLLG